MPMPIFVVDDDGNPIPLKLSDLKGKAKSVESVAPTTLESSIDWTTYALIALNIIQTIILVIIAVTS